MIATKLPASIAISPGAISQLAALLDTSSRALLVTNRHLGIGTGILGTVADAQLVVWSGEPDIDSIEAHARMSADLRPDVVVGVGGGSVLDVAKALAAALPNADHPFRDHLEVVGTGRPLQHTPLPVIAVPTTAGTGSEMTKNAVLDIPSAKQKVSLRDPSLVPRAVIIDPDLAEGNPAPVRAACALDAAVQLVESYATPLANPMSDLWAAGGAQAGLRATTRVVAGDNSSDTRLEMAFAAMCSGAALASSKLGTIHGFAGVLGGATGMAHGQLCGLFAAPVLRRTIQRLQLEQPDHQSLDRYRQLSVLADRSGREQGLAEWFGDLVASARFDRSPIADLSAGQRDSIVAATQTASSTAGNPIELSTQDLHEILDEVANP